MSAFWMAIGGWWLHAAVAGGVVLLLGWAGVKLSSGPARRQRVAAWTVRGAVLAAGLCALPSWLILPTPEWAKGEERDPNSARRSKRELPSQPPTEEAVVERSIRLDNPPPMVATLPREWDRWSRALPVVRSGSEWVLMAAEPLTRTDSSAVVEPLPLPSEPIIGTATALCDPLTADPQTITPTVVLVETSLAERVVPLLVIAYFTVAGVLLLQLVLGHLVLLRLTWSAVPLTGKARWVFDRLTETVGVRPRAFVSDRIPSPICYGFLRPTVLLPRRLAESVGEDELRWVLAHELDHVQRGDHRSAYWTGLARAVFFFVPWFWPVRKELGLSQEYLADAAAAEAGGHPVDYAAFLVDLSGTPLERRLARPSLASTGVRAGQSDLFRRVNMLLNWGSRLERRVPRGFAVVAAGGMLTAAVGLSGLGFAAAPPPEEPKERTVRVTAVPVEGGEVKVAVAVDDEDPPAPPAKPAKPATAAKSEDLKALKAKIEKAIKEGKADEARELLNQMEKAAQLPALPPTAPLSPRVAQPRLAEVPRVQPVPPVPPVAVAPRGDWGGAVAQGQGQPFVAQNLFGGQNTFHQGPDLRKQYEQQLKDFEKAIKDTKDDEAREQLTKARDEYKKAMEEAVKKTDEAREEMKKGMEMNRNGQAKIQDLIERQRQLQQRLLQNLPRDFDRFQLDRLQQLDPNLFQGFEGQGGAFVLNGGQFQPFNVAQARSTGQPRLGVRVEKVPTVVLEQLDLPKDSGVVVVEVVGGSVAEKAGVKKNDILVRLAGKDVPTDPEAFTTLVGKVKGGEKVEAVVVRKGKKETIKGIELPEPKKAEARGAANGGGNSQVQVQISDDDVTLNATQDGVGYAVTGKIEKGKLTPDKITVTEGKEKKSYDSLDKVPEEYRGTVEKLISRVRGLSK